MADRQRKGASKRAPQGKTTKKQPSRRGSANNQAGSRDSFRGEVALLILLAVCILLFISNFGIGGIVGEKVSQAMFGVFGLSAYLTPICIFAGAAFYMSNRGNRAAIVKLVASILFVLFLCVFLELALVGEGNGSAVDAFKYSSHNRNGGGFLGGLIVAALCKAVGLVGAYVVTVVALIISLVLITERSFFGGVKKGGRKVYHVAREESARHREQAARRREEQEQKRMDRKVSGVAIDTKIQPPDMEASDNLSEVRSVSQTAPFAKKALEKLYPNRQIENRSAEPEPEPEDEQPAYIPISRKSVEPVAPTMMAGEDAEQAADSDAEIAADSNMEQALSPEMQPESETSFDQGQEPVWAPMLPQEQEPAWAPEFSEEETEASPKNALPVEDALPGPSPEVFSEDISEGVPEDVLEGSSDDVSEDVSGEATEPPMEGFSDDILDEPQEPPRREHVFPPSSLLKKSTGPQGDNQKHMQETALKLQQTLKNFGVSVTITDVSCGPAVTRYELQPEVGVKVSKIVNLADDIKLNLAAADIRIEAPIPGKAAIGIEVPNKENVMVRFRDMVESEEFQKHSSSICFTAGKDISGQTVVADIAKMPHLLIAGATGSGKSVCINTIIMSLLYKADPEDVKLILIDPKVVELSIYNGIPHLFIPVVTDPKKAAGALHWAVAEMTERYQKFAALQVRDLKSYNRKIEEMDGIDGETHAHGRIRELAASQQAHGAASRGEIAPARLERKLPQIVIVVDELADLMMVAPGEVEDAICRLAQLARAAGIHLIIATQRPSVDVITGLIKANMPSRIAFSVSSSIDSRTILDMNGAEKLLGNGDMLFYPQGYQKPLRVQGPFVSDPEVEAVVDFLKNQSDAIYNEAIEARMNSAASQPGADAGGGGSERDAYFADAGRFIIEKEKGSIGMLQRWFKVGFNRAARIMDQLEEAGVVGPEEGTKPRRILMNMEQFEAYIQQEGAE